MIAPSIDDAGLWRGAPLMQIHSPAGHIVQLSPGVDVAVPMAALVKPSAEAPAPISFDHVAPRIVDVDAEISFLANVLGLRPSALVVADGVGAVITFYRSHTLCHCYTVVRARRAGVHHYQFSFNNAPAVLEAYEKMRSKGVVELVWGPVRRGP